MIAKSVIDEIRRQPAFEEDADIGAQDADSMRFHARALLARARYAEDKDSPMLTVSVRWARVLAKCLNEGADAKEVEHG